MATQYIAHIGPRGEERKAIEYILGSMAKCWDVLGYTILLLTVSATCLFILDRNDHMNKPVRVKAIL